MRSVESTADRRRVLEGLRRPAGWPSLAAVTWISLALVTGGVVLRLVRYLADRSLWLDESYLAINLMTRSYRDLLETLDYNQGAPVGFLWAERFVVSVFGDSELVLRFFPLVVSLAALVLFYGVARDLLRSVALVVALLLFATMEPFVRYAAEVKQYGLDVGVTVGLLYVFVRIVEDGVRGARGTAVLAVTGPLALFFSHPSVFVLTGLAVAGGVLAIQRGDTASLRRQALAYGAWLVSSLVVYVVAVRDLHDLQQTVRGVGSGAGGGLKNLYTIFNEPGGFPRTAVGLAATLTLVGAFYLWRRRPGIVVLGAAASGSLLAAGLLGVYPVGQRFLLFLLPIAVLCLAEGVGAVVEHAPRLLRVALVAATLALIIVPVVGSAAERLVSPPKVEEIEPLLGEIVRDWREGDVLVLYPASQYAFRYYQECEDCSSLTETTRRLWPTQPTQGGQPQWTRAIVSESPGLIVGTPDESYLDRVTGRGRVWILYTHFFPLTEGEVLAEADRLGTRTRCSHGGASILCLYDFSG